MDIQETIKRMPIATIYVDRNRDLVKANTDNSAFQLFNEGVIENGEHKKDTWYPISGSDTKGKKGYGYWVLEHEFPNTKGDEYINVTNYEDKNDCYFHSCAGDFCCYNSWTEECIYPQCKCNTDAYGKRFVFKDRNKNEITKEKNIFEGAKFSDKFITRDGRTAVYLYDKVCWVEGEEHETEYLKNGLYDKTSEAPIDIVAKADDDIVQLINTIPKSIEGGYGFCIKYEGPYWSIGYHKYDDSHKFWIISSEHCAQGPDFAETLYKFLETFK